MVRPRSVIGFLLRRRRPGTLRRDDPPDPVLHLGRDLTADGRRLAGVEAFDLVELKRHRAIVGLEHPEDLDALDRVPVPP